MLLAVDTSTMQIGLALFDGAQVISEYSWRSGHRHTTELAPATADLLMRCGLTIETVRALGVALGPGSFTSLRVGLAFVKGLAIARHIPLMGIPTLDVLANAQPVSKLPLAVAIQAGRGRFALGWYKGSQKGWQAQGDARVVTIDGLLSELQNPCIVCGEFPAEVRHQIMAQEQARLISPAGSVRRPAVLAELAWARWQNGDVDEEASLAPIYIHVGEPIQ